MKPVKMSTASQEDPTSWISLYHYSSQVTKQHSLNRSQFNWRVSTNQLQRNEHNVLTASPETSTDTDKLPAASGSICRTPIHKTTPPSLSPITGVILKPSRRPHRRVSGGRTPVNSKYKWRRRLSSSGVSQYDYVHSMWHGEVDYIKYSFTQ